MSSRHRVWRTAPLVVPGDQVAILSPSWAGPGVYPLVHERSLRVIREELHLVPVEFPTTREVGASPQRRARDIEAAFADPTISAIFASIGGEDQITVLQHLDPDVLRANPTRFFGYSDNTNLLNYLWNLGIVSYHGGSTMAHLARAGGPHPLSFGSLKTALFTNDAFDVLPTSHFTEFTGRWADPATWLEEPPTTRSDPWVWSGPASSVSGVTWGGNLEILHWNLAAGRWMGENDDYDGCVLLLETSEEMPSASEVYRMMRNMGERGLLAKFVAVVVATALARNSRHELSEEERRQFRERQRDAVAQALSEYNRDAVLVYGPDFGHTDPQYVIPLGVTMTVDALTQTIKVIP